MPLLAWPDIASTGLLERRCDKLAPQNSVNNNNNNMAMIVTMMIILATTIFINEYENNLFCIIKLSHFLSLAPLA